MAKEAGVLIDGGASHNVYYSATVPEGAEERDVDLAHGSRKGYLLDHDIIFIDKNMSHEQGRVPSIISMGRLVTYGAQVLWGQKGVFLKLPDGKIMKLRLWNKCPHANEKVVKIFEELKAKYVSEQRVKEKSRSYYTPLR